MRARVRVSMCIGMCLRVRACACVHLRACMCVRAVHPCAPLSQTAWAWARLRRAGEQQQERENVLGQTQHARFPPRTARDARRRSLALLPTARGVPPKAERGRGKSAEPMRGSDRGREGERARGRKGACVREVISVCICVCICVCVCVCVCACACVCAALQWCGGYHSQGLLPSVWAGGSRGGGTWPSHHCI